MALSLPRFTINPSKTLDSPISTLSLPKMALTGILRRSASTVAFAARSVAGQRLRHTAAATSFVSRGSFSHQPSRWTAPAACFPSARHYSASSDKKLLEVIQSEIQCAVESNEEEESVNPPEGFPFKIEDIPGEAIITLEREYDGETITVEVSMPNLVTGDDGNDEEEGNDSNVPLTVRVEKSNGAILEFSCTAFPDEITIDALSMKNPEISEDNIAYEGPEFSDLDENLQQAFHKYLEIRGIKPSTTNFLHEYMINKDNKEYLKWLNELKQFVKA